VRTFLHASGDFCEAEESIEIPEQRERENRIKYKSMFEKRVQRGHRCICHQNKQSVINSETLSTIKSRIFLIENHELKYIFMDVCLKMGYHHQVCNDDFSSFDVVRETHIIATHLHDAVKNLRLVFRMALHRYKNYAYCIPEYNHILDSGTLAPSDLNATFTVLLLYCLRLLQKGNYARCLRAVAVGSVPV
jgi:hypothetical protein